MKKYRGLYWFNWLGFLGLFAAVVVSVRFYYFTPGVWFTMPGWEILKTYWWTFHLPWLALIFVFKFLSTWKIDD
jgi:hypothetical protein